MSMEPLHPRTGFSAQQNGWETWQDSIAGYLLYCCHAEDSCRYLGERKNSLVVLETRFQDQYVQLSIVDRASALLPVSRVACGNGDS